MKILLIFLIISPICCWGYALDKDIKVDVNADTHSADATITKRSGGGSFDFVAQIKKGLLAGVGRASAAVASGSSGSSSSFTKHEPEVHENSVEFDPWSLKKSVLNTLFQAVKAITGGVTAIKGQLIKGSGYVLSAGGSLIAASGDKITDVGKGIVQSAQLSPIPSHSAGGSSFAGKFASLSGASSSGSSGSSGGAGGGHTSAHESTAHGPTGGHGETITTYDIPTGHQSYGPPSKAPAQYLPPGTYTSGLHFSGPASFESSPHHAPYLPAEAPNLHMQSLHHEFDEHHLPPHHHDYNHHHQHHHYENSDTKYSTGVSHQDELVELIANAPVDYNFTEFLKDFNSHSSGPPGYGYLTDRDSASAGSALKEIMHFLPRHETKKLTATYIAAPNRHKMVDQFEIPSDPVPKYTNYRVGPVKSISHSETITTAFGAPPHNFQNKHMPPHHHHQPPSQHNPIDPISHHPYDAYHTMTLKHTKRAGSGPVNPNSIPGQLKTPYHVPQFKYLQSTTVQVPPSPPQPTPSIDIEALVAALEAKKRKQLAFGTQGDNFRPVKTEDREPKELNFEVKKSIAYQITDPDLFNRQLMY